MILMTVETHQSCKKGVVLLLLKKRNGKEIFSPSRYREEVQFLWWL